MDTWRTSSVLDGRIFSRLEATHGVLGRPSVDAPASVHAKTVIVRLSTRACYEIVKIFTPDKRWQPLNYRPHCAPVIK